MSTGAARLRGFSDAMTAGGAPIEEALLPFGAPRPDFGRAAVDDLWSGAARPPTALIIASTQLTLGVIEALHRRGVTVPDGVSLVSYGDADWFLACQPAITAVHLPIDEAAVRATKLLLAEFAEKPAPAPLRPVALAQTLQPALIVRQTTAPLRGRKTTKSVARR